MAERPVAIVTGTSRDVGKYIAIGLAESGYDILGVYRNPQNDQDQADVIREVRNTRGSIGTKPRMVAVRADLLDKTTPGLIKDKLDEEFGGKAQALVVNTAGGMGASLEDAREINVLAQMRLVDTLIGSITPGGVLAYNTSYPAHRFGSMDAVQRELLDKYGNVAQSHFEGEQSFRFRTPEFTEGGIRLAVVVGNGLEGTFVTGVLKRKNKEFVSQMLGFSERGYLPTLMNMADAAVEVVRDSSLPTGHTEYVGIAPEYQLYPSRPSGLSLVGAPEMRPGSILSREEIYGTIPHRWPFMFIGGVSEVEYGKRAVGSLVDLTHPDITWRPGHFPDYPLVPGVITQEALQQLGALVVLGMPEHRGMTAVLTGVDQMRFLRQIKPGDDVKLEVEGMDITEEKRRVSGMGHVRALNSLGKVAVEGIVSFALINTDKK